MANSPSLITLGIGHGDSLVSFLTLGLAIGEEFERPGYSVTVVSRNNFSDMAVASNNDPATAIARNNYSRVLVSRGDD